MGRNKKLTKAVRERMARTNENYTAARTALLSEARRVETLRLLDVEDLESGTGDIAEDWRTLHVTYEIRRDGQVVDASGPLPKPFALSPHYDGWMRALVGQRVGGRRRLEVEFVRRTWGRCTIEASLIAVGPYVASRPHDLVRGRGRAVGPGDRVRIHYIISVGDAVVGTTGASGLWITLGSGELEPDLERIIIGMCTGGTRTGHLPPREGVLEREVWLDLIEIG